MFNETSKHHQNILNQSGYDCKLHYKPPKNENGNKRNTIWFNSLFSKNFSNNIDKYFSFNSKTIMKKTIFETIMKKCTTNPVKVHLNNMETIRNHSVMENIGLIQNFPRNTGDFY